MMQKNRLCAFFLAVFLIFSLIPGVSLGEEGPFFSFEDAFSSRDQRDTYDEKSCVQILLDGSSASCPSEYVSVSGSTVTIQKKGTYLISGRLDDGMIIVDIDAGDKVQLILSNASIHSEKNAPIYIRQADKVFITLAEGTDNYLSNGGSFQSLDGNNIDAAIFSKEDLAINGSGALIISSPGGHGVVSKDDLIIAGGNYQITASGHGLCGKDSLRIAKGEFSLETGKDALHAEHDEDAEKGYCYIADGSFAISAQSDGISASGKMQLDGGSFRIDALKDGVHTNASIYVSGGSFEIATEDDGFHADSALIIAGGSIRISKSYEGLEGQSILISGGDISLKASDDGLNAAGGNDQSGFGGRWGGDIFAVDENCHITISGGKLLVDAGGDGIDSNGHFTVTGGETYVSGPTNSGNGALDFGGTGVISGGIFLAAGSAGMAQSFDASSTQGVILASVNGAIALEPFTLQDAAGNELMAWQSQKNFNLLIVSCPEIKLGETYTLTLGDVNAEITMEQLVYTTGGNGGPGGPGKPGGPGSRPGRW